MALTSTGPEAGQDEEEGRFDALRDSVRAMEESGVPYLLMGGLAAAVAGRPRTTKDIDFFVAPGVGELGLEVQVCHQNGHDEVPVSGKVTTEERRAAVAVVVEEIVPGAVLRNEVVVVTTGPPDVERLL